jgi:protein-disulfide isomerase
MEDRSNPKPSTLRRLLLLAASLGVGAVGWFLLGLEEAVIAEERAEGKALARIDGNAILEQDVLDAAAGEILKIKRQHHQLIENVVHGKVRDRLLELGAEEMQATMEVYLENEVRTKTAEIPAEEVNAFYEARKANIRQPLEAVEAQIRDFLAMEALVARLEAKHEIEYLTEPFRVDVAGTGPAKGSDKAPITIVEFSDFQCPYCSRVNPAIKQVRDKYGDKVRVVFRQFPLAMHDNARKAGEASLCAAEQDNALFWKLHDAMFADQQNLSVEGLKGMAGTLEGLDSVAFNECLDSDRQAEKVEQDLQDGTKAGVSGTPAFFVNGRFLSGAATLETFAEIIDDELKRKS